MNLRASMFSALVLITACGGGAPVAPLTGDAEPPPTSAPTPSQPAAPIVASSDAPPTGGAPAAAAAPAAKPTFRNVLVISVDAMRADMPWNGYPRAIAPNLTALEKKSVSYSRAYSLSSYTAMSMGGFLAGRYPGELMRSGYFFSAYPKEETLFPELLQKEGVTTISAQAHFYFDELAGFRQGFDIYEMVPGIIKDAKTDNSVTSPEHVDLAIETLKRGAKADEPFFAWYHFMDPHDKYRKHEGFEQFGPTNRDRYDGEIFFADHHIGRLLDFVKKQPWADHTAIVVTADHGEAFGEKNMTRHAFELWEVLVHVPMFVYIPGVEPRKIDMPRSHIDLAPTIFELLGKEAPSTFQGHSLVAEITGKETPPERDVIVDLPRTSHNWRRRALVRGQYKIIAFGDDFRFELYDVIADPEERTDLRQQKRDVYEDMRKRYLERVKSIRDICPEMRHKLKGKRPEKDC